MQKLRYSAIVLSVNAIFIAIFGLLLRWNSDWKVAWTSSAGMFALVCLVCLSALQPRSSRRYRWSGLALWVLGVGSGVVLSLDIPDRSYKPFGVAIVLWSVQDVWRNHRGPLRPVIDRVKPVLYFMFGEPDPVPDRPIPDRQLLDKFGKPRNRDGSKIDQAPLA
jgi:hypothetical protein